jgi:predicted DNA-binding transcriptional regulator YafY
LLYRREGAEPSERIADPLGLVASGPVWYLVAAVDGDIRTYRVSRVDDATMLEEPVVRPPGFDLAAHWEASKVQFVRNLPVYEVSLRLDAAALPTLHRFGRPISILREDPPNADGLSTVVMRFDVFEEAREAILGWGPRVEVLAPEDLRAWVIDSARGVLELYEGER